MLFIIILFITNNILHETTGQVNIKGGLAWPLYLKVK